MAKKTKKAKRVSRSKKNPRRVRTPEYATETVGASAALQSFPELIERVKHTGNRILVERRGREMAALVPVDDLRILEALEDAADLAVVKARLREKTVPAETVFRKLGL